MPKTRRAIIIAFLLLNVIWSFHYFNLLTAPRRFAKLPIPPKEDIPEYSKIDELTAAAEHHVHNNSTKSWFFGAVGDAAVAVEESLEWFRLAPSQSTSAIDVKLKTKGMQGIGAATPTTKFGAESQSGSGIGSLEESVAPTNLSASHTMAAFSAIPSSVTDTSSISDGIENVLLPTPTPLILYAYAPASWALPNLNFFLKHGLHGSATFIFIINGALVLDEDAGTSSKFNNNTGLAIQDVLRILEPYVEKHSNVKIWKRPNTCYDLGAYAKVLKSNSSALVKSHEKFILINASLRGPFVPFWSRECWSDTYLRLLDTTKADSGITVTKPVKLVGMTINCAGVRPRHIQSMILATDRIGMDILLGENTNETSSKADSAAASDTTSSHYKKIGIDACPTSMDEAVNIEVSLTSLVQSYNYSVRAMMAEYWSKKDFEKDCTNGDVNAAKGAYEGGDLGVFETLFIKTRWAVEAEQTERLTQWYDGAAESGMSKGAWDKCG